MFTQQNCTSEKNEKAKKWEQINYWFYPEELLNRQIKKKKNSQT